MREEAAPLTPGEIVLTLERHFLELMRWPARLSPVAVLVFVVVSWIRNELSPWAIGLLVGYATVGTAVLSPGLAHARRKRLIVGGVSVAAIAGLLWYGPLLGVGVLFLVAVGLAAWLDTRAGTIVTCVALASVFPICALCARAGWLDSGVPTSAYVRIGLVATVQMALFSYVMRRLRARQFELLSRSWDATRALQASEARFGGVFESAPDALLIVDADGRITQVNRRAEDTFGYTRDELVGLAVVTLVADEYRDALRARTEPTVAAVAARRKDGTAISVEISLSRFESGMLAAVRDTSERTRMEEERSRLAARSQQAQKMESLGTLAGGIAHDFNNLLAVILTNLELVRRERDDATRLAQLGDIETASQRAAELVRQILSFSRKGSTIRVVTSLGRVVEDASRLLRASIPAGIEIATSVPADLPPVLVDAGQVHQVLMNLGTNAWHAIERPTGRIGIEVAAVELPTAAPAVDLPAGRYVRIRVTDDGVGMDAATCARVFEPFFSTKPVGKGTGLGMSVAHGIVATHGGAIAVESAPGRGTAVDVYLPDSGAHREATPPEAAPVVPSGVGRVLVVDDEQLVATATARLVRRLGYQVTTLVDAAEALYAVTAEPGRFDLVLTDENMPGIGGLELARRMLAVRADLRIVLASGNSQHSDAELAAAGVRHRIDKPYDPAQLGNTLAAALAGGRRDSSPRLAPAPDVTR